ncbi:hypothetical protein GCM10007421_20960 [Halopseudomonas oceani]|uniref:Cell division protein n=1 Tax=Halopseudomonas oceani TaxID=1708783 RepID=A0A2P4EVZ6_9GAMM|nr:AAA family ATPase [Halopseudomonas oceani]POB03794.1 cell division protein [Halopseudomonas oceani]GGE46554.1 hypothetical protein GCM10007421_20960 [Halopseudomonas oceani]
MSNGFDEVFSAVNNSDELLEHYQLNHDPFSARTPGFKFFTPKRRPVLAELHHLARYGEQMLVVAGPLGAGKTLLRQALVASSNKDAVQCVVLSAREHASEAALLAQICQALNTEQRDVASLLAKAQQSELVGIQLYIVIDDAELLESSAISMLSEIAEAGSFAPRVFLFVDSEGLERYSSVLNAEEGSSIHVVELAALGLDETREYLAQRLEGAGQGIELLTDQQVDEIHQRSAGWPGAINQVGRQVMVQAMHEGPVALGSGGSRGLSSKLLLAAGLVAVGIGVAWYLGDKAPAEPERTVLQLPEPVVEAQVGVPEPVAPPAPAHNAGQSGVQSDAAAPVAAVDSVPVVVAPESSPEVAVAEEVAAAEIAPQPAPQPEPAPQSQPAPEPAPTQATVPTPAPPVSRAEADEPATVSAAGGPHRSDWYRARSGSEYVVQLLGTRSEQAARSFVSKHPGVQDVGYFETTHQGAPWFVVTQGIYSSRQAAQAGVSSLPAALRDSKPWPRSIADIQAGLR